MITSGARGMELPPRIGQGREATAGLPTSSVLPSLLPADPTPGGLLLHCYLCQMAAKQLLQFLHFVPQRAFFSLTLSQHPSPVCPCDTKMAPKGSEDSSPKEGFYCQKCRRDISQVEKPHACPSVTQ